VESIPDYSVGDLVGIGLLGPVRQGRYLPTGAPVAMEAVPAALRRRSGFMERLATRGRTAASLREERIVAFYDLLTLTGGELYLVSEQAAEPPLRERVPDGRGLPLGESVRIAGGVLAALEPLHAAGLTHGALSRSTVLERKDGTVRLLGIPAAAACNDALGVTPSEQPPADLADTANLLEQLLTAPLAPGGPQRTVPRAVASVLRRARRKGASGFAGAAAMLAALQLSVEEQGRRSFRRPASIRRLGARVPPRGVVAGAAAGAGVVLGLALNTLLTPAYGSLRVRSLALDVDPARAGCSTVVRARADGEVEGNGELLYRWSASGGLSTAIQALTVSGGRSAFDVAQTWRPKDQGPATISFEVLQPAHLEVSRTVDVACAG
jgi:hypothetical protein